MWKIAILALIGLFVGFASGLGIKFISVHVENKQLSCAYSCILGVIDMLIMTVVGYILLLGTWVNK